jgi:PhnB protein
MRAITPYLMFERQAQEAFEFYRSVFGADRLDLIRVRDMADATEMPEAVQDLVAHVSLTVNGRIILMASDNTMDTPVTTGSSSHLHIAAESEQEVDKLFGALSAGGTVEMEPQQTEWSRRFGMCVDKFGVKWMVDVSDEA